MEIAICYQERADEKEELRLASFWGVVVAVAFLVHMDWELVDRLSGLRTIQQVSGVWHSGGTHTRETQAVKIPSLCEMRGLKAPDQRYVERYRNPLRVETLPFLRDTEVR